MLEPLKEITVTVVHGRNRVERATFDAEGRVIKGPASLVLEALAKCPLTATPAPKKVIQPSYSGRHAEWPIQRVRAGAVVAPPPTGIPPKAPPPPNAYDLLGDDEEPLV
jgi:hypothetical protein